MRAAFTILAITSIVATIDVGSAAAGRPTWRTVSMSVASGAFDGHGDAIEMAWRTEITAEGAAWMRIIFADVELGAGSYVLMRAPNGEQRLDATTMKEWFNGSAFFSGDRVPLELYVAPGDNVERVMAALRERAAGGQDVIVRSNRALRDASLEIFDRTFSITAVLRLLIVAVAFVGVLSALMALQLERGREHGVLRALGLTPGQVWGVVTAQTGLIGLVAGLLAVPVGIMLAAVLVFVINRRSFGWTMPLDVAPLVLAQGVLLAVTAALLAGIYPACRMAAASPVEALREE